MSSTTRTLRLKRSNQTVFLRYSEEDTVLVARNILCELLERPAKDIAIFKDVASAEKSLKSNSLGLKVPGLEDQRPLKSIVQGEDEKDVLYFLLRDLDSGRFEEPAVQELEL